MDNNNTFDYSELPEDLREMLYEAERTIKRADDTITQSCENMWDAMTEAKGRFSPNGYAAYLKKHSLFDYTIFDRDTAIKKMREQLEKNLMELSPEEFCNNPMRFVGYNNEEV